MNIDVNKPVENPALLEELRKRSTVGSDRQAQINLMNNIMHLVATQATFLVIIKLDEKDMEPDGEGKMIIKKDAHMQVQMISSPDGKHYIPLFTDWPSLRQWDIFKDAQVQTLVVGFDDVMALVNENTFGVVINPFSENLCITTPQLQHMKQVKEQGTHISENRVTEDTPVQIGEAREYPANLVNAIKEYAESDSRVKEVHIKMMTRNGQMSFLLVIDHDGDLNEVFKGIAGAGRAFVPAGLFLEMVPLDSQFGQQVITTTFSKPIYKK